MLKYCRAELMQDNYFHAVFEAAKGLAQRIREESGVDGDGASLVDQVFSVNQPILAFNTLQTETEKSEHKGFAALLKGCFGQSGILALTSRRSCGRAKTMQRTTYFDFALASKIG